VKFIIQFWSFLYFRSKSQLGGLNCLGGGLHSPSAFLVNKVALCLCRRPEYPASQL